MTLIHDIRAIVKILWWAGGAVGVLVLAVAAYLAVPYLMAPDSLNRVEANAILQSELQRFRERKYAELEKLVGTRERKEILGGSGARYQLVVSGYWDGDPQKDIRVVAAIDDGGRSAWIPMTGSFILSQAGRFVGEESADRFFSGRPSGMAMVHNRIIGGPPEAMVELLRVPSRFPDAKPSHIADWQESAIAWWANAQKHDLMIASLRKISGEERRALESWTRFRHLHRSREKARVLDEIEAALKAP